MIDLHRHLEGSVRYATLKDIAREAGVPIPPRRDVQVGPRDPRTLKAFLKKFDPFFNLYPSRDCVERVAREAAEDAAADGIVHLELRFSPVHFARRMKACNSLPNRSARDVATPSRSLGLTAWAMIHW